MVEQRKFTNNGSGLCGADLLAVVEDRDLRLGRTLAGEHQRVVAGDAVALGAGVGTHGHNGRRGRRRGVHHHVRRARQRAGVARSVGGAGLEAVVEFHYRKITGVKAPYSMIVGETGINEPAPSEKFNINQRFDFVEKLVGMVADSVQPSAIITGEGGLGKTYTVTKTLEANGYKDISDLADFQVGSVINTRKCFTFVKGYSTPKGLYRTLFENNKGTIVFDDCDSVLLDDLSLNILKAALDSSKKRTISWNTDSALLRREGIPDSFEFKGAVIFITNLKFDKVRGKIKDHLDAIMSRCHYLDLTMDTPREKILRCRQIVADGMLNEYDFTKEQETEIVDFISNNQHRMREVSLRMVTKVADLRKSMSDKWERMAECTCMVRR